MAPRKRTSCGLAASALAAFNIWLTAKSVMVEQGSVGMVG